MKDQTVIAAARAARESAEKLFHERQALGGFDANAETITAILGMMVEVIQIQEIMAKMILDLHRDLDALERKWDDRP